MLKSQQVALRAMEPSDVPALYLWENDTSLWQVSDTVSPFSKETLKLFVESSMTDNCPSQIRLMIDYCDRPVGCIDLFEISHVNHHASLGILVHDLSVRGLGVASQAIRLCEQYALEALEIITLKAEVNSDNIAALRLFSSLKYEKVGVLKNWKRICYGKFEDVTLFQHVLD